MVWQLRSFGEVKLDLNRFASRSRLRSFLAIPPDENAVRWEAEQRQCGGSFHALCQYVFTIAACDPAGERLLIGLWPGLKRHLEVSTLRPPPPPAAKAPATTYVAPFVCADIAAVIVHAATKPITLKQTAGLELYAAEERIIAARLEELPSWIGDRLFSGRVRASVATFAAAACGWLTMSHRKSHFIASETGRDWLALPAANRLQLLLDYLRDVRWGNFPATFCGLPFAHVTGRVRRTASDQDILACEDGIAAAFRDVPTAAWTETEAWLDHAALAHNPIVATVGADAVVVIPKPDAWRGITWVKRDAESLESEARTMLADFLFKRLIPLGGAEIGCGHGKTSVFRLNEIGRYYIGASREFPAAGSAANGRVIVQPNFEIMILGSHMLAEADLAAFCERTGAKSGAVFRITRKSIQQAFHNGATADSVIATLRGLSDCELPANVVTEIGGWAESRKTFFTRPATLLVCPDATVAARIRSLLPAVTVPLNDTTLELLAPLTAPQHRKLKNAGIFKQSGRNPTAR